MLDEPLLPVIWDFFTRAEVHFALVRGAVLLFLSPQGCAKAYSPRALHL